MESLKDFNRLANQANKMLENQQKEFDRLINNVENIETKSKLKDLLRRAKNGSLTSSQLQNEIQNINGNTK